MGNKLRFINNADKKFTNCSPKNLLCNQVNRIGLFASTNIKAGKELFFDYNYPKSLTETFRQPNQAPSSVVAVKKTVIRNARKQTATSSDAGQPGKPKAKVPSARVLAGLEKARAAKAQKAAQKLGQMQAVKPSIPTTLSNCTGLHRVRKSVPQHTPLSRSSRVSQLRSTRSRQGRDNQASFNPSDTPILEEATLESGSEAPESMHARHTNEVQDTDDDEFIPDGTQGSTNSYDALFTTRSNAVVEKSDDLAISAPRARGRTRKSPGGLEAAIAEEKSRKKKGGTRPKRRRDFVGSSDYE